ncbi:KH domain-containing protein [Candidatus Bipolaricaulota bacterium]|nr:KH domain-containing protein [Candidatus Bipolaricaulota bacterium]
MLYRLCRFLVTSLVEDPDAVRIERIETERVDIFLLRVAKEDRGRILGRGGRTIGALRIALDAVASYIDREVVVEIMD